MIDNVKHIPFLYTHERCSCGEGYLIDLCCNRKGVEGDPIFTNQRHENSPYNLKCALSHHQPRTGCIHSVQKHITSLHQHDQALKSLKREKEEKENDVSNHVNKVSQTVSDETKMPTSKTDSLKIPHGISNHFNKITQTVLGKTKMPAANADSLKIPYDMAASATATEFDDERFILHLERNLFLEQIEAIMDCGLFQE